MAGRHRLLHTARADLLRRAGRDQEAANAYAQALSLVSDQAERNYVSRRLVEVREQAPAME